MELPVRLSGGARTAAWPVLELVVSVGVQVLLTPLLLHRLGPQQFGIWILAQTALLASAALSLGASTGLLPVLSAALHAGGSGIARTALRWFYRRVALVATGVLACAVAALALNAVPDAPGTTAGGTWALVLAGLAWMVATELDNAAAGALKAQGRFGTAARSEVVARLAQLALIAALVGSGSGALEPIALSLILTVAKYLARLAALRRVWALEATAPAPAAPPTAVERERVLRDLATTGLWIWAGALGSLAFNAFDRWFVGAWFGASTLAAYAVCIQLTQLPHATVAAAGQVLVPWAARQAARDSSSSGRVAGLKLLALTTTAAALPSLLLLPLLEPVLAAWISPAFAQTHLALAQGLAIAFLLLCLNVPGYFLLLGMGRARFATVLVSVSGLLFVLGALLLPRELSTFVLLKIGFALLALGLPIGCALLLRTPPVPAGAGPREP